MVKLGRGARLRSIDPSGQWGLVYWIGGSYDVFDVRRLVRAPRPPFQIASYGGQRFERITGDRRMLVPNFRPAVASLDRMEVWTLDDARLLQDIIVPPLRRNPGVSSTNDYYYVAETEVVVVIAPDHHVIHYDPLPRSVIHAAHLDHGLLVSATWGHIAIDAIEGPTLNRVANVATPASNPHWVARADRVLAAIIGNELVVWPVSPQHHVGTPTTLARAHFAHAALARDGRYLAVAVDRAVAVYDIERGSSATFTDHTDDLSLVAFTDDHRLVTADCDNRVIVRPRSAVGYTVALRE